jgi:hypothetical protein
LEDAGQGSGIAAADGEDPAVVVAAFYLHGALLPAGHGIGCRSWRWATKSIDGHRTDWSALARPALRVAIT